MIAFLILLLHVLVSPFKTQARLEAEIVLLRHQLSVLRQRLPSKPRLTVADRLLFVWLYRLFPSVLNAVTIIQPETVIRWHRTSFRLYWRWKSRSRGGRPRIPGEIRRLIREMSLANRLWGALRDCRYLLHDRDTKFTRSFRAIIASGRVEPLAPPAHSPNLNAYAERWVRSVKEECLSKIILFGERSLRRALNDYVEHFHAERNHQGKDNVLLFPLATDRQREGPLRCHERLGGLLRY
jgi:hypothetical protein